MTVTTNIIADIVYTSSHFSALSLHKCYFALTTVFNSGNICPDKEDTHISAMPHVLILQKQVPFNVLLQRESLTCDQTQATALLLSAARQVHPHTPLQPHTLHPHTPLQAPANPRRTLWVSAELLSVSGQPLLPPSGEGPGASCTVQELWLYCLLPVLLKYPILRL